MRAQIQARGAKTIRGLGRVFRNFDSFDGNHKVDAQEFFSGLREIQIDVTEAEAKVSIDSYFLTWTERSNIIWQICCALGPNDNPRHEWRRSHRHDWVPRRSSRKYNFSDLALWAMNLN